MSFPTVPAAARLPRPSGTPSVNDVPQVSQVSPLELEWGDGGGGGGGNVDSVEATDASIVVAGTADNPTIATGTVDAIATQHPAAASWSNNSHKITSLQNGASAQDAAAYGQTLAGGDLAPMTTAGDLIIANATPAPARLAAPTAANQFLGISAGLPAWLSGLTLQTATSASGYALINGTGNIITWTAPNDGALHTVLYFAMCHITSAASGSPTCEITGTAPDGGTISKSIFGALTSSTFYYPTTGGCPVTLFIEANTTFSIIQNTSMTAGAGVVWASIWAN